MSHIYKSNRPRMIVASAAGDLEPTEGEARRSHTLRVGRYAQHFVDALQMDSNPVEYLMNKYPKVRLTECHPGYHCLHPKLEQPGQWGRAAASPASVQKWRAGLTRLLVCLGAALTCKGVQAGLKPEQMRQQLGRFGLSGHHHLQPICKLSGGQKARVVFTSISLGHPHILLLDEPTNHLDMQSIDALAEALEQVSQTWATTSVQWGSSLQSAAVDHTQ